MLLARFPGGAAGAQARAAELRSRFGISIERQLRGEVELTVLRLPADRSAPELARALERAGLVEYAEPDYLVHTQQLPDDSLFSYLWAHRNTGQATPGSIDATGNVTPSANGTADADMDSVEAWDISTGSASVVLAVLDSGGELVHEDLRGNLWVNPGDNSYDGIDNDNNGYVDDVHGANCAGGSSRRSALGSGLPWDDDGHGSHVAGIAGAVGGNAKGVVGVNQRLSVMVLRFITVRSGYTSDAVACLSYLAAMVDRGVPVRVVNNSWGATSFSQSLYDAIAALERRGVLFVAAAGNDDDNLVDNPHYPASYADELAYPGQLHNVLSVAASDHNDARASFSNYGSNTVRIAAPGVRILSLERQEPSYTLSDFDTIGDGSSLADWDSSNVSAQSSDGDSYFSKTGDQFYLHSPKFDLSRFNGSARVVLRLRMRRGAFNTTQGDHLRIALSADTDGDGSSGLQRLSQNDYQGSDRDDAYMYLLRAVTRWLPHNSPGDDSWHVAHLHIPNTFFTVGAQLAIFGTVESDSGIVVDIDHLSVGIADSTVATTAYDVKNGTSMAAPQVAGAAALALSLRPAMAATELMYRIAETADRIAGLATAVPGSDGYYLPRAGDAFYDNMSAGAGAWDAALSDLDSGHEGWHITDATELGRKHYAWQIRPAPPAGASTRQQSVYQLASHRFDLAGASSLSVTVASEDFPPEAALGIWLRAADGSEAALNSSITLSIDDVVVIEGSVPSTTAQNGQRLVFKLSLSEEFDRLVRDGGMAPALRLYEIGVGSPTVIQYVAGGRRLNVHRLLQKVREGPLSPDMDGVWDADDFVIGLRLLSGFAAVDLGHNIELPAAATPEAVLGLTRALLADSALDVNGDGQQDRDDLLLVLRRLGGTPAALLGAEGASLAEREATSVAAAIDQFLAR